MCWEVRVIWRIRVAWWGMIVMSRLELELGWVVAWGEMVWELPLVMRLASEHSSAWDSGSWTSLIFFRICSQTWTSPRRDTSSVCTPCTRFCSSCRWRTCSCSCSLGSLSGCCRIFQRNSCSPRRWRLQSGSRQPSHRRLCRAGSQEDQCCWPGLDWSCCEERVIVKCQKSSSLTDDFLLSDAGCDGWEERPGGASVGYQLTRLLSSSSAAGTRWAEQSSRGRVKECHLHPSRTSPWTLTSTSQLYSTALIWFPGIEITRLPGLGHHDTRHHCAHHQPGSTDSSLAAATA